MEGMTDTSRAVVPYHDPYDHEVPDVLSFVSDSSDPTLDALFDGGVVPSSPHQYPIPQFENGIQDDDTIWEYYLGNNPNWGGINNNVSALEDHPSQCPGGGGGESGFDQNLGLRNNVTPPPVGAPPPIFFNCSGCQVLRVIVHINCNYTLELEIHGTLGAICHAIQESRVNDHLHNSGGSIEPHYQNIEQVLRSVNLVIW